MIVKRYLSLILALICVLALCACGSGKAAADTGAVVPAQDTSGAKIVPKVQVEEDGEYTTRDEVAAYIYLYHHLPSNYITKKQAGELGWEGGSVEDVAPDKTLGGTPYGNYEGTLPDMPGRHYYECDVDNSGSNSRGAKRLVYSNDGLIFYTDDHYETFTLLYGGKK